MSSRSSSRRHFLTHAGALTGAALLAACGPRGPAQPSGDAQAGPVRLGFLIKERSTPAAEAMLRELVADHNRQHARVQIELEFVPGSEVNTRLTTRAIAGQAQDFVESGGFSWVGFAEQGFFTELTPLFKRDRLDTKLFIPEALSINSKEGKIWGWPSSTSADAIAFNMDLFDAAGLKHPPVNPDDKSWTTERFQEYAVKLTRGREQFGLGSLGISFWTAGTFFGQGPWDDAARKAQMNTPNYIKGLQYFLDLRDKHRTIPNSDEVAGLMAGQRGAVFISGKIGMQLMGPFVTAKLPFRWGLATLPYSGAGRNLSGRQWSHGIFMGAIPTARQEGVWQALKWLLKPEPAGRYVVMNGHAVSALLKGGSDFPQQYYREQSGADAKAYLLQAQYSRASGWGMLNYSTYNDVDREHSPLWIDALAGKISVGEYAQRAADLWTRNLGTKAL